MEAGGPGLGLPAHLFAQLGDVGNVMFAVPSIQREIFFQRHHTQLWVAKGPLPLFLLNSPQEVDETNV